MDDQVGFKLGRAFTRAYDNLRQEIGAFDITPQQMAVIMRLSEQGEVSQNSLGRMVGQKPATIHGIIKRLSGRGFVDQRRSPEDQRLMVVSLTTAGRKLAHQLQPHSIAASAQTLKKLNRAEQRTLKELLDKLVRA